MNRDPIIILLFLSSLLLGLHSSVEAQPKIARIGYLSVRSASSQAVGLKAVREGLRELGYVEGKNILFEYRFADRNHDRARILAAELVALKVDLIVTAGSGATRPTKELTSTIPIVFAQDVDPVGNGFVASLARPGGNVTGLSTQQLELTGKRLEILKEVLPKLSRLAVFGSESAGNAEALKDTERAAAAFGIKVQYLHLSDPTQIGPGFQAATKAGADAVFVLINSFEHVDRKRMVDLAAKYRLPVMYFGPTFVEDGGLMSYGVADRDLYRRAAVYVDKILKGAKPADLPVEQPTKFELVINLQTAKQIGLTIPPNVLARADRVIR
jgi:putative ABC transport system substrate-binding protein